MSCCLILIIFFTSYIVSEIITRKDCLRAEREEELMETEIGRVWLMEVFIFVPYGKNCARNCPF